MSLAGTSEAMRPPINRAMRALDRSFFKKTVPLSAARVLNNQYIAECRKTLLKSKDILLWNSAKVPPIRNDPLPELAKDGRKCILLREDIKADDASTWPSTIQELTSSSRINIIPYQLDMTYEHWDYDDIINAVLPQDLEEIPHGFTQVGHIAHLNLREHMFPYKLLVAEVLLDKNPTITTVINKTDTVGTESAFRTFSYEVLAGKDDMAVEIKEGGCIFSFNYAQVYWNSRLQEEHRRMVETFEEGQAICDVMAGVGPFACPAGKKKVFAWANDLNPASYQALEEAIKRNKIGQFVIGFNTDGHEFIRSATQQLWHAEEKIVNIQKQEPRSSGKKAQIINTLVQPRIFSHFVLNLPASALEFLPNFIGLYSSITSTESRPAPTPDTASLPLVHAYCFSTKSDDNVAATEDVRRRVSGHLGFEMKIGELGSEGEMIVRDVRDVAPKKRMFCASFRLPAEVAWRARTQ